MAKLKGKRHREARAIARGVLAFSAAMADERKEAICSNLADGNLRFDIETTDPPLVLHRNLDRPGACASLQSGALGRYVREFGPSHPHADAATLLPALFAVHGSAYMHLPTVQLDAYAVHARNYKDRGSTLRCTRYRASRLPANPDLPKGQRRYDVELTCRGVAHYHLELQGNRRIGFKVRKVSIKR